MLPLIEKDGFSSFSLEIFVIPKELSANYSFLFLEQYHLLYKHYELNTQRVVNFRVNLGKNVYIYDTEGKILYYSSISFNQLQSDLRIHFNTYCKCVKEGKKYLDFFIVTHVPIEGAKKSNLSLLELNSLIAKKQTEYNRAKGKSMRGNLINPESQRISITALEVATGNILTFPSLTNGAEYIASRDVKVSRWTISNYLNTGKPYQGYIFSKSDPDS